MRKADESRGVGIANQVRARFIRAMLTLLPVRWGVGETLRGSRLSVGRDRWDRGCVGDRADPADEIAVRGALGIGAGLRRRASRLPLVAGPPLTLRRRD